MVRTVSLVLVLLLGSRALAQDDTTRLRLEVAELRDQLAQARQEIIMLRAERDALASELADAKDALAALSSSRPDGELPATAPEERRAEIPADPYASPDSLRVHLRDLYDRELKPQLTPIMDAIESGETTGEQAEIARAEIEQLTERWINRTERSSRGRGEWIVDFLDVADPDSGDPVATFRLIDGASNLPIGDAITRPIERRIARLILRRLERARPEASSFPVRYRAFVVMKATPTFTDEDAGPGLFGSRDLVGDFVEFGYEIDWIRILPLDRPLNAASPSPDRRPR